MKDKISAEELNGNCSKPLLPAVLSLLNLFYRHKTKYK